MLKKISRIKLFTLLVLAFAAPSACKVKNLHLLQGSTMGTIWSVKIAARQLPIAQTTLQRQLQSELDLIESLMSTYQADSQLQHFNNMQAACYKVSAHTLNVAAMAIEVGKQSKGAFDVTLAPLIKLWGFDAAPQQQTPTQQQIDAALAQTGMDKIYLRQGKLCKTNSAVSVNFSAIAKGYAVDVLADLLKAQQIDNFLIEVGGELYASGQKSPRQKWKIGIEAPIATKRAVFEHKILELTNKGIATSGDYRNFYSANNKRYAHTISSKTGYPVENNLASVTVVANTAISADAHATAIMAIGAENGLKYADDNNLAVLMIMRGAAGFSQVQNQAFETYLQP